MDDLNDNGTIADVEWDEATHTLTLKRRGLGGDDTRRLRQFYESLKAGAVLEYNFIQVTKPRITVSFEVDPHVLDDGPPGPRVAA